MKRTSPSFLATVALVAATIFSLAGIAQAPATPQEPAVSTPAADHHPEPAPTNLRVLPKTMTGDDVHELMHKWEAALGTECSTCHTADPNNIGPNGRPRLNYADDSKPEKAAARLMYKMVEEINTQYVNMIDNSGVPVTCGTCHRGHLTPEPFAPTPKHEHHDHAEPTAPAGEKPAAPH